jgi:hypothetical protein
MELIAFGDSFTSGFYVTPIMKDFYEQSYVARLCEIQNSPFKSYKNFAKGGWSNHHIAWDLYKFLLTNKKNLSNIFILIGWTSYHRFPSIDKLYNGKKKNSFPYHYNDGKNTDSYPISEEFLISQTDLKILGCCNLLRDNNVKFAMINSFADHSNHEFSSIKNIPEWINGREKNNTLLNIIQETYLDKFDSSFDGNLPYECKPSKYVTPCCHPSNEGHYLIAKTLLKYLTF